MEIARELVEGLVEVVARGEEIQGVGCLGVMTQGWSTHYPLRFRISTFTRLALHKKKVTQSTCPERETISLS